MARCARCGEDNPPGATRCRACGADLTAAPVARRVSVLVVDLAGPGAPADDAVTARARREIRLLGGSLGEDGSHVAVGVFGAPVARADAAERAVRAALRVAEAIDDLRRPGVAVRAAIHTGTYALT